MKKNRLAFLLTALALTLVLAPGAAGQAITWHTANQSTVAWDAVTTRDDGADLAPGDLIEYVLYTSLGATDDPVEHWRGAETSALVTMSVEGSHWVGLQSVRRAGGIAVSESVIVWSDDPLVTGGSPFGLRYYRPPAAITGLHRP